MDIEIELKLLATETAGQDIKNWLQHRHLNARINTPVELTNYYYDTQDRQLRQADMGLRIRSCNGVYEQTIKTRGSTLGGLHQRPEYNVPLAAPELELSLFNSDIWPEHLSPLSLQSRLDVLFTTTFRRQIFVLTLDCQSVVEVVFDLGHITSGSASTTDTLPICELELELKHGRAESLFELAKQICQITPVHFGNLSKAARGYYLLDGVPPLDRDPLSGLSILSQHSVEDSFSIALEYGLRLWQSATAKYFESHDLTELAGMLSGLKLLSYSIDIYQIWLSAEVLRPLKSRLNGCFQQWQWLESTLCYKALCAAEPGWNKDLEAADVPGVNAKADNSQECKRAQIQLNSAEDLHLQLDIVQLLLSKAWRRSSDGYQLPLAAQVPGRIQDYLQAKEATIAEVHSLDGSARLEYFNQLLALSTLWGNMAQHNGDEPKLDWRQRFAGLDQLAQLQLLNKSLTDNVEGQPETRKQITKMKYSTLLTQREKSVRQLLVTLV